MAVDRKIFFHWFAMPVVVFLLGLLSVTLLVLMNDINERQRTNFAFSDALMDLQIKTATAHLWLEEAVTEDLKSNAGKARANLAEAVRLSQAILHGGESEYGLEMRPLRDPALVAQAEKVVELLSEFGTIAELRLSRPKAAGPGSELDVRFDRVFAEIQETASALEHGAEISQVSDYDKTTRLFLVILFTWSLIVVAATVGLWTRESRRKRAEDALQNAKDELESRVAQRTAELTDTNRALRQEIAGRNRMLDFLQESDSKFRRLSREFQTVLQAIPDNITLISPDLRVLWTNRDTGSAGKTGDIAGQHCCNLWGAAAPCTGCPALSCFRTGKAENAQVSRPDGSIWDIRALPVRDDDGKIKNILEIATDITDKVTIQAETMRAMHLASIGELAAGVAHEINNPVNGIINYARLLSNRSARDSDEYDIAERIAKEGRRIAGIVRSLLSFARYEKEEKRPVRVQQILFESLTLTESQMRKEG
ncbi:MAG: PAS domain-containing protein, partial [Geobacteraceae bacterium]|nr:PAS domain-containing protein [Geobacteraceae bacterium]